MDWTSKYNQADLLRIVEENKLKKIKSLTRRKTKNGLPFSQVSKAVAKKAGFQQKDVIEIFKAFQELFFEQMAKGEYLKIDNVGSFYPILRTPRHGTNLKGGNSSAKMIIPPFIECKFLANDKMINFLKDIKISEEQINELYE